MKKKMKNIFGTRINEDSNTAKDVGLNGDFTTGITDGGSTWIGPSTTTTADPGIAWAPSAQIVPQIDNNGHSADNCRLCGKDMSTLESSILKTSYDTIYGIFCTGCTKTIKIQRDRELMKELVPKKSVVHCYKCFSHIRACRCKGKKAIDALKK